MSWAAHFCLWFCPTSHLTVHAKVHEWWSPWFCLSRVTVASSAFGNPSSSASIYSSAPNKDFLNIYYVPRDARPGLGCCTKLDTIAVLVQVPSSRLTLPSWGCRNLTLSLSPYLQTHASSSVPHFSFRHFHCPVAPAQSRSVLPDFSFPFIPSTQSAS